MTRRDLALVALAALVAVLVTVAVVVLAVHDRLTSEAIAALGGVGLLGASAIGRLSGANQPTPTPEEP